MNDQKARESTQHLTIREMEIKASMRNHYLSIMDEMKTVGEDVGQMALSSHVHGSEIRYSHFGK